MDFMDFLEGAFLTLYFIGLVVVAGWGLEKINQDSMDVLDFMLLSFVYVWVWPLYPIWFPIYRLAVRMQKSKEEHDYR